MTTEQDMRAATERWVAFAQDRVAIVKRAIGKDSLTVDEGFDLWVRLRRESVLAIAEMVKHATRAQGTQPACRGCTDVACCHGRVDVLLMDAVPILRGLEKDGGLTGEFLQKCLERNHKELRAGKPSSWIARKTPCILLDPLTSRCTVYDLRPVPCAQLWVWSDPVHCWTMDPDHLRAFVSPPQKMLYIQFAALCDQLIGIYDPGNRGTTLAGALWLMGTVWDLRNDPKAFQKAVRRHLPRVMLTMRNTESTG